MRGFFYTDASFFAATPLVPTTRYTPIPHLGLEESWHQQTTDLMAALGRVVNPVERDHKRVNFPHPARFTVLLADINGPVNTSGHRQTQ
jgi:hypothetical protein